MRVPAKVEYAIQAAAEPSLVKAERIANAQQIPPKYLGNILTQLRNAGLVESHRGGTEGGYRLARPADQITLADIFRAVDGPLVSLRSVLEQVTLADLVAGTLPSSVCDLTDDPDAWISH